MVARVTPEIALRKEFDYTVPAELAADLEVGSRVKVPFGSRQVFGVVTALLEPDATLHTHLRGVLKVIGRQGQITPKVLALARWIADYYCCAPEIALKSVLPEAVRHEGATWRECLFVRPLPPPAEPPKLTRRQEEVYLAIKTGEGLPLRALLERTGCTPETVRRLEDKGLVVIAPQVSERDPYAHEHILPTPPLVMNAEQTQALSAIQAAFDRRLSAGAQPSAPGASSVFLLQGVTGSGKTEVY